MSNINFDDLSKRLLESIVTVRFTKADKTLRTMKATLMPKHLPAPIAESYLNPANSVVTVWDLEKKQWRSFHKENVISIEFESQTE